ncbi:MAG TPA: DUF6046 domain-containing protein [Bacteroidales bacterium]|nr:DUF6046 domain-containing protein [Bacteroidales bacterium]
MTPALFKLENLFPASFGGVGVPFPGIPRKGSGSTQVEVNPLNKSSVSWPDSGELNIQGPAFGVKYYLPVGFRIEGKLLQLPLEPSMTLDFKNNIIKTSLAGNTKRGTVKELIGEDDIAITIQGLCLDPTRKGYPTKQVEILKTIWNYKGSIEIVSMLTAFYEIKNVVLETKSLPAITGRPYSQPYSFTLLSDEDFLLVY